MIRLFGNETKNRLPLGEFLTAVGQLKFRGTSVLFRLPQSCVSNLKGYRIFLGHLSHSGDLLLWVGVRRRASSVVRRPSCVVR